MGGKRIPLLFTNPFKTQLSTMETPNYTKRELDNLDTIEQAWDGDELKIDNGNIRVWLVTRENRPYNGDYVIETLVDGRWIQESFNF